VDTLGASVELAGAEGHHVLDDTPPSGGRGTIARRALVPVMLVRAG
jgi:hypothetical protein